MSRGEGFAEYITEDVLGHIDGISRKVLFILNLTQKLKLNK
jgi:hypothetical protein